MASAPVCQHCGAALPRSALFCARCGRPAFLQSGRRLKRRRDAAVVGMAGSLVMAAQSVSMGIGGVLGLVALSREFAGARSEAFALGGLVAVFLGFTLLFDLVGVLFLSGSFYLHLKTLAPEPGPEAEAQRRRLAFLGLLAAIFLLLWVAVTVAWRAAAAAIVGVFPTPLGADIDAIATAEVRSAALVVVPLWVAAASLLFLGARFGARFLRRLRNAPPTFGRLLWPLETFVHVCAAVGIALLTPIVLARPNAIELTALRLGLALLAVDFVAVPALGLLAYAYLFRDFRGLHRGSRGPASAPPVPPEAAMSDPPGEA